MKIVIDIDEEVRNELFDIANNGKDISLYLQNTIIMEIVNGTPLPKGHGRLIDADAFIKMMEDVTERQRYKELLIDDCLTVDDVIEAIIESLQNEGLAEGDSPTIIEAESGVE